VHKFPSRATSLSACNVTPLLLKLEAENSIGRELQGPQFLSLRSYLMSQVSDYSLNERQDFHKTNPGYCVSEL
jgi:hypothetical protein